jgi:hypothetical protein
MLNMDIGEAGMFDFGSSVYCTGTEHTYNNDLACRRTGVGGRRKENRLYKTKVAD